MQLLISYIRELKLVFIFSCVSDISISVLLPSQTPQNLYIWTLSHALTPRHENLMQFANEILFLLIFSIQKCSVCIKQIGCNYAIYTI